MKVIQYTPQPIDTTDVKLSEELEQLVEKMSKNGTSEFSGEWIEFGSKKFPDRNSVLVYLGVRNHKKQIS